ncbi:MAG TPA: non-homologous end-joining DNA ligase [Candidatus Paceibacterota bacterium]
MRITKKDLRPMLATLIDEPFDDPDWIYEIKWDGFRVMARIERGSVTLLSRSGIDVTKKYPVIADALKDIQSDVVIDGELVALDRRGVSHFQLLQRYAEKPASLYYYVFDLLFKDGTDVRRKPLLERKRALRSILPKTGRVRYSEHIARRGSAFFISAARRGLEGIIAKRAIGRYYSDTRTREWLKIKCAHEQEAIIVGFTKPKGSRKHFGSLVLAVFEGKRLAYVGHSGGGFDERTLRSLHKTMLTLKSAKPLMGQVARESDVTWIRPKLVAEIKFTEWTKSGQMRHPVFLGLRNDKPARMVIREVPKRRV